MILAYAALFGLVQIVCTYLALRFQREKDQRHEKTIQGLLNRIQAPELAVAAQLTPENPDLVSAVGFDDDDAYWQKRERTNG